MLLFLLYSYLLFYNQQTQAANCLGYSSSHGKPADPKCDFKCDRMANPKKVINPYKNGLEAYVKTKPFASICLRCSMCMAVAKELDSVFKMVLDMINNVETKQTVLVDVLVDEIEALCEEGFDNYDLRKFKQHQVVTDEFSCSSHVRTSMDGQWTGKLREMCWTYINYLDVQYLLNEYLKKESDMVGYLCKNEGIFRDCTSLDSNDLSDAPFEENPFLKLCEL